MNRRVERRVDDGDPFNAGWNACFDEMSDEIERLRSVLVEANNRWRHDFAKEVEDATDKLFKKMAAHRTNPFGTRKRGIDVETKTDAS